MPRAHDTSAPSAIRGAHRAGSRGIVFVAGRRRRINDPDHGVYRPKTEADSSVVARSCRPSCHRPLFVGADRTRSSIERSAGGCCRAAVANCQPNRRRMRARQRQRPHVGSLRLDVTTSIHLSTPAPRGMTSRRLVTVLDDSHCHTVHERLRLVLTHSRPTTLGSAKAVNIDSNRPSGVHPDSAAHDPSPVSTLPMKFAHVLQLGEDRGGNNSGSAFAN